MPDQDEFPPRTQFPPADVVIVSQLPDDRPDAAKSLGPQGIYDEYDVRARWENDRHVAMLAATDPTGSAAFVPYASPTKLLVIEYTVQKTGGPPRIPPEDLGANLVLLEHTSIPSNPKHASDPMTITARVEGRMVFGVADPAKVGNYAVASAYLVEQLLAMKDTQQGQSAAELEHHLRVVQGASAGIQEPLLLPLDAIAQAYQPQGSSGQQG